jgi:hypothetical protein
MFFFGQRTLQLRCLLKMKVYKGANEGSVASYIGLKLSL